MTARPFRAFAILVLLALTAGPGSALADPGIETVIRAQIKAFQADDAIAAFGLASPAIQQKFQNPQRFLHMVATAYPQVYRPKRLVFLEIRRTVPDEPVQKVLIEAMSGDTVMAYYPMVRIDGRWRVNGCILARPGGDKT